VVKEPVKLYVWWQNKVCACCWEQWNVSRMFSCDLSTCFIWIWMNVWITS